MQQFKNETQGKKGQASNKDKNYTDKDTAKILISYEHKAVKYKFGKKCHKERS